MQIYFFTGTHFCRLHLGRHEGCGLDVSEPGSGQPVNELDLGVGRDEALLVLVK